MLSAHTKRGQMKKKRFTTGIFTGAWLLTAAMLISKLMGAFYRIPLTRALGAHGMGMFQSVFPSYALIVTLTGGGLTAAVSKLTAENGGKCDYMAYTAIALAFSVPVTLAAALFSRFIAAASGAPDAVSALLILLPSVPLSAVGAVMRGYFQGRYSVAPSAIGQLIEQAAKLVTGLTLSFILVRYSVTAAVAGCAAGVTVAEAASLLYYFAALKKFTKSYSKTQDSESLQKSYNAVTGMENAFSGAEALTETSEELLPANVNADNAPAAARCSDAAQSAVKSGLSAVLSDAKSVLNKLLKISLPVTLGLTVLPLCRVADSFTVVNLLIGAGAAKEYATALYGIVTGPVDSLVNLPAVFMVGLCAALLPKISGLCVNGEKINGTVKKTLVFSLFSGLIMFAGLCVFAPLVLRILYGNSLGAPIAYVSEILRIAAISVPFMIVMQTSSAVLQGMGKAFVPACNLFTAAIIKEILNFVLLPAIGIFGFAASTVAFFATGCVLNIIALIIALKKQSSVE